MLSNRERNEMLKAIAHNAIGYMLESEMDVYDVAEYCGVTVEDLLELECISEEDIPEKEEY